MLRITSVPGPQGALTLQLAGRITGPWVEEMRRVCEPALASGRSIRVDLAQVSFLDQEAAELCRRLRAARVELVGCSPFLLEQIARAPILAAASRPAGAAAPERGSAAGNVESGLEPVTTGGNEP